MIVDSALVELTPNGRKLRKDFDRISKMLIDKLYGDMNKKDRQLLVSKLDAIETNIRK